MGEKQRFEQVSVSVCARARACVRACCNANGKCTARLFPEVVAVGFSETLRCVRRKDLELTSSEAGSAERCTPSKDNRQIVP